MSPRADPLPLGRALDDAPMSKLHPASWGLLVTIAVRIETRGRALDELSAPELSALRARVTPA